MGIDRSTRAFWLIFVPLLIFAAALTVRAAFIHHWGSTLTLQSDDLGYIESGRRLAADHVFSYWRPRLSSEPALGPTTYITPGYPLFLAFFFRLFGDGSSQALAAARYAQAIISAGSVLLVFYLGKHFGGRWAGFGAAMLCAFYPPFILLSGLLLTETLFTFSLLLFAFIWLKVYPANRGGYALLGVTAGLAALLRPTGAVLVMLALCVLGWRSLAPTRGTDRATFFSAAVVLAVFFCLTLSPWWIRNAVVFHRFIPLSEGGGNPLLLGTYVNLEGIKYGWNPEWPVGKDPMETSSLQTALALERLETGFKEDFGRYFDWYTRAKFKLLWFRAFLWGGEEKLPPVFTLYLHYIILSTGVLGLAYSLVRRLPGAGRLLSILAAYTVTHLLTYAHCRYALPLLPLLSVFAFIPFAHPLRG
ncbi:MAG: glycosyltransferase family 39 protein, partial [Bacillota bacterium]